MEQGVPNMEFRQVLGVPMNGSLCQEFQQFAEPRAFLKRRAADDSLDEMPSLIDQQVFCQICICRKHWRCNPAPPEHQAHSIVLYCYRPPLSKSRDGIHFHFLYTLPTRQTSLDFRWARERKHRVAKGIP